MAFAILYRRLVVLSVLVLAALGILLLAGCQPAPRAVTSDDVNAQLNAEALKPLPVDPESTQSSSVHLVLASEDRPVHSVLVDQDYAGISSVKGLAWVKAIGTKKISGTSKFAFLTVTLSRNGNEKGIDALGVYLARLDDKGFPIPELEWRHVRYLDAMHLNGTRAIEANSGFTTLGTSYVTATYDLSGLPATPECNYDISPAQCPGGLDAYDILGALKDNDFWLGFLPSRSTAHVKVTLSHDGGLTVTDAVK